MTTLQVYRLNARASRGWTALARVRNPNGAYITEASLDNLKCKVKNSSGTETYDATLTISEVVFDTLETDDARWTVDDTGFNFLYEVPASAFPAVGHYRVEFLFDPASGEDYSLIYEGPVESSFTF